MLKRTVLAPESVDAECQQWEQEPNALVFGASKLKNLTLSITKPSPLGVIIPLVNIPSISLGSLFSVYLTTKAFSILVDVHNGDTFVSDISIPATLLSATFVLTNLTSPNSSPITPLKLFFQAVLSLRMAGIGLLPSNGSDLLISSGG